MIKSHHSVLNMLACPTQNHPNYTNIRSPRKLCAVITQSLWIPPLRCGTKRNSSLLKRLLDSSVCIFITVITVFFRWRKGGTLGHGKRSSCAIRSGTWWRCRHGCQGNHGKLKVLSAGCLILISCTYRLVPGQPSDQRFSHRGGKGLGHPGQFSQASDELRPGPYGHHGRKCDC